VWVGPGWMPFFSAPSSGSATTRDGDCRWRLTTAQIDILGLGASTIDIVTLVDHLPATEEVQRALDMTTQGGGPVATAIVAAARLGATTAMIDAIGDDWRGALIRSEFEWEGVYTDPLLVREGFDSPTSCILVDKGSGARFIVFWPGSAPALSPQELPRPLIESTRFLHVNGRHWDACLQAVTWARRAGVQVSFDGGAHRYRPEMKQLVPLCDISIIARDFAEQYTGETGVAEAARYIAAEGPRLVVITQGEEGSWIHPREGRAFHQPAFLLSKVVDTTGCGDSYHGAFLFALLRGFELEKAAALASAVAALNTQCLGGRAGLPTLERAEGFLGHVGVSFLGRGS